MEYVSKIKKFLRKKLHKALVDVLYVPNDPPFLINKTWNIEVGRNSYHNGNFIVKGYGKVKIGSFCAIGQDVKIILSNHNYNYPSIQYSVYERYFNDFPFVEHDVNRTSIGNDVWIGDNVVILPNVKIGNGACIGAGSIVTKDVPDFAICAGNPAKIIKNRFNEEQISYLQEINWWNWTDEEIIRNRNFFFTIPFKSKP